MFISSLLSFPHTPLSPPSSKQFSFFFDSCLKNMNSSPASTSWPVPHNHVFYDVVNISYRVRDTSMALLQPFQSMFSRGKQNHVKWRMERRRREETGPQTSWNLLCVSNYLGWGWGWGLGDFEETLLTFVADIPTFSRKLHLTICSLKPVTNCLHLEMTVTNCCYYFAKTRT